MKANPSIYFIFVVTHPNDITVVSSVTREGPCEFLSVTFSPPRHTIASPACCWENLKGEISCSNGAVFFGMPL